MTELLVIRHGETDWNRAHRFQGQIDVPLNATGLAQAERLGQRLADEPLDLLLCSDLQRAAATAAAVARHRQARHGRPGGLHTATASAPALAPEATPLVDPLWREQAFGVLEGLDVPTIQQQHPGLWQQWVRHEADFALPGGGESNRMFHDRVMRALQAVLARFAGQRVAIFSHGGVLDMLWREARGEPLSGARRCEIPNTGINRLRWTGSGLAIVQWADAAHLDGLPLQPTATPPLQAGEP